MRKVCLIERYHASFSFISMISAQESLFFTVNSCKISTNSVRKFQYIAKFRSGRVVAIFQYLHRSGSRIPCRRGVDPPLGANIRLCQIFQKALHEIEKISGHWGGGGAGAPGAPVLDPPLLHQLGRVFESRIGITSISVQTLQSFTS